MIGRYSVGLYFKKKFSKLPPPGVVVEIVTNKNYSSPIKKRIVENDHQFCRLDDEKIELISKFHENEIIIKNLSNS